MHSLEGSEGIEMNVRVALGGAMVVGRLSSFLTGQMADFGLCWLCL